MANRTPRETPVAGQKWCHHKGRSYNIVGQGFDENGEVVVIHSSVITGVLFTRTLSNFMGLIPETMEQRFVLMNQE